MDSDDTLALKWLQKQPKITEAYVKKTFEIQRQSANGSSERITVTVLDAGNEVPPQSRYMAYAESRGGKSANGNQAPDIATAISILHWHNFD